jgi:cytidylate kinase
LAIGVPERPVDQDPFSLKSGKLFHQELKSRRTDTPWISNVAGKQEKIDAMLDSRIKHVLRSSAWRISKQSGRTIRAVRSRDHRFMELPV